MIKAKSYNYGKKKSLFETPKSNIFGGVIKLFQKISFSNNVKSKSTSNSNNHKSSNGLSKKGERKSFLTAKVWIILLIIFVFMPLIIGAGAFYVYVLKDLPSLASIEVISLPQTINIADRDGKILYKYSSIENREYVAYDDISENMVNAIIAVEDQNFRNHGGIDIQGIARAGLKDLVSGKSEGASTITQQLIKNLFLSNEKKILRKLKEITLAIRLSNLIQDQVTKLYPNATSEENSKQAKKKVMELYLNFIFLGNNSYGIQSASYVYFGTSAKNLDILQSSIIATLPKAPSTYDPYRNKYLVMGKLVAKDSDGNNVSVTGDLGAALKIKITDLLNNSEDKISRSNSSFRSYLLGILDFDFEYGSGVYKISYNLGRKDISLERMYVEGYIDESQIKLAFLEGLFDFKFQKQRVKMQAPHFVNYILDLIKTPNNAYIGDYSEEMIQKGGFTITTTLDSNSQKMAEESIEGSMKSINGYGANNTALIHLDTVNGDILAYVGSADFYNEQINGQVDILRSKQQPGSTIKPLVYTLGFMNLALTLDTDIYDIDFKRGNYDPDNFDNKFMGPLPIRKALAYSRNIPAIKMFLAAGGENLFISFLKSLGVTSINQPKGGFGSSMAIGSADMTPLDLAIGFSHLSAMGKPAKVNPILEIKKFDNTIIYKRPTEKANQIIPSGVAYLIWNILSDIKNLPPDWVSQFKFPIKFAGKTGTTNKQANSKGVKFPKDGWMVAYTPSKLTIFRAGNTNDQALKINAYGGWMNNQTRKLFRGKLLKAGLISDENPTPVEVKEVTISKLSGRLATEDTPRKYVVTTLGFINKLPTQYDDASVTIQVDKLCGGKVSDLTPSSDIVTSYIVQPATFMPDKNDLGDIARYLGFSNKFKNGTGADNGYSDVYSTQPTEVCEERLSQILTGSTGQNIDNINNINGDNNSTGVINSLPDEKITSAKELQLTIQKPSNNSKVFKEFAIWYNIKGGNLPTNIAINVNGQNVGNYSYTKDDVTDIKNISIDNDNSKNFEITVTATDSTSKSVKKSINVALENNDKEAPFLVVSKTNVKKSGEGSYSVNLLFSDQNSKVKGGIIFDSKGKKITDFNGNLANFDTSEVKMLKYEVSDAASNIAKGDIDISTYIKA